MAGGGEGGCRCKMKVVFTHRHALTHTRTHTHTQTHTHSYTHTHHHHHHHHIIYGISISRHWKNMTCQKKKKMLIRFLSPVYFKFNIHNILCRKLMSWSSTCQTLGGWKITYPSQTRYTKHLSRSAGWWEVCMKNSQKRWFHWAQGLNTGFLFCLVLLFLCSMQVVRSLIVSFNFLFHEDNPEYKACLVS